MISWECVCSRQVLNCTNTWDITPDVSNFGIFDIWVDLIFFSFFFSVSLEVLAIFFLIIAVADISCESVPIKNAQSWQTISWGLSPAQTLPLLPAVIITYTCGRQKWEALYWLSWARMSSSVAAPAPWTGWLCEGSFQSLSLEGLTSWFWTNIPYVKLDAVYRDQQSFI